MFRRTIIIAALLLGCNAKDQPIDKPPVEPPPVEPPTVPQDAVVPSSKARLTFKGGARYAAALGQALSLPQDQICSELSQYDCVADVHRIALLDVEPYQNGILKPLDNSSISSPIAVERVAYSACARRARLDFDDPSNAELFAGDKTQMANALYQRLLSRDAEQREIDHLLDLHAEMAAVGDPDLDQVWAATACFAVATTTEALFY